MVKERCRRAFRNLHKRNKDMKEPIAFISLIILTVVWTTIMFYGATA